MTVNIGAIKARGANGGGPTSWSRYRAGTTGVTSTSALGILGFTIAMYMAFGKGFSYAGYPPFFVGELVLAFLLLKVARPGMAMPRNFASMITIGLLALASVQVLDDLLNGDVPTLETLRGFAVVYYSGFAFVTFRLLRNHAARSSDRDTFALINEWLHRWTAPILIVSLALALQMVIGRDWSPRWPSSGVQIFLTKPGDISVALAILLPVIVTRHRQPMRLRHHRLLLALWLIAAILVAFRSRGAMLGMVAGALVALEWKPTRLIKSAAAGLSALILLYVTNLRIPVGGRTVSWRAVTSLIASLTPGGSHDVGAAEFNGTRDWRSQWWSRIWDDVIDQRMILHGRGWGDNLATRHRIAVPAGLSDLRALRLPHNIFFSLAGRAGLLVAFAFLAVIITTVFQSRSRRGVSIAEPVVVRAARGGLVAALVTGLTDVYLESPQGGIVMWSASGFLWWVTSTRVQQSVPAAQRPGTSYYRLDTGARGGVVR